MLAILGIVLLFGAVFGGYLLERGNPYVLIQPAELLIVGGAAAGITLVANPPAVIRKMWAGGSAIFRQAAHTRESYLRTLCMLYEVFGYVQRAGIAQLEKDVEAPGSSPIFSRYPEFLRDRSMQDFVCDSLRMLVIGVTTSTELDQLMDIDAEVQRRGLHDPVGALSALADSLPGLGIVAAVLGVVITMEAIGESPQLIGQKVAAALVGTFIGILLCYGVVGPVASRMENYNEQRMQFLHAIRTAVVAFTRGSSPLLAIEYSRRSIPLELRPGFSEMETIIRREAKIPHAREGTDLKNAGTVQTAGSAR